MNLSWNLEDNRWTFHSSDWGYWHTTSTKTNTYYVTPWVYTFMYHAPLI